MSANRWGMPVLALLLALVGLSACTQTRTIDSPLERRQPVTSVPAGPLRGDRLAALSTVEQLALVKPPQRDQRELALQLNPALEAIPLSVPARSYASGDQEPFWVRNTATNRATVVTATLVYSTPVAYVWIENGQPFDRSAIERSADRFTTITYPNVVTTFGSEWQPGVDNDPRLHILYNTQMGDGVIGYFSGADEYTRAASPFSNQKEMFYINLAALNRTHNYAYHDTTLAHEFQHMIHWHMDRGEDLWINEGLSEYAQEVADFAGDTMFVAGFAANPDLQLTTWQESGGNNGPHYGSAYLFIAYLAQRFGREAITALVAAPANGLHGVDAALQSVGADIDAEQLFADWVVANYAGQPDALVSEGRYGYVDLTMPRLQLAAQHTQLPVATQQAAVGNYATDYIELAGAGDAVFSFQGAGETQLAETDLGGAGRIWWSNRADDAAARLTQRYDLAAVAPGTPLTLTAAMWWEIEAGYDYGYVMASADGRHWQILSGRQTAADDPSGNALGPGYTAVSGSNAGKGDADEGDAGIRAQWVDEAFDLSAYAGGPLWLQFSYITDDAVNQAGWLVKDVQLNSPSGLLPALDASDEAVNQAGWQSEGWLLTDNRLPQRWLLQVLEFDGDTLTAVRQAPVDDAGMAQVKISGLGDGRRAVVAISGLAPVTTLPAHYAYTVTAGS